MVISCEHGACDSCRGKEFLQSKLQQNQWHSVVCRTFHMIHFVKPKFKYWVSYSLYCNSNWPAWDVQKFINSSSFEMPGKVSLRLNGKFACVLRTFILKQIGFLQLNLAPFVKLLPPSDTKCFCSNKNPNCILALKLVEHTHQSDLKDPNCNLYPCQKLTLHVLAGFVKCIAWPESYRLQDTREW